MQLDPSIFKAYDIRGIYGQNLNETIAEAVGKAFTVVVSSNQVVVGRDGRVSSPQLREAIVSGLTSSGVNVIDIGQVSTDMYYHACAEFDAPGIMVTASHNPKEYNGFKMVKKIPQVLSGDEGIQDIRQLIENNNLPPTADQPGSVTSKDIMSSFIDKMLSLIEVDQLKPMKVIIDTANGMVGPSLVELFKQLPQLELVPMYFEIDGTFPNHGGDPLDPANRAELEERVVSEGADLGFAFDPDGDRFFCIDASGRFVAGDYMTALLGEHFLSKHPGAKIVYDLRASWAVPEKIEAAGGTAIMNRVGHAFIKHRMMTENAVFGGEVTGHYYFKDFYFCDSGIAPMLFVMEMLSQSDQSIQEIVDTLEREYVISGEINTKGVDAQKVMQRLKDKYQSEATEITELDGVSMVFPDWHFNVRSSNTEPLVRLNLEANSQAKMIKKRDEVLTVIRQDLE